MKVVKKILRWFFGIAGGAAGLLLLVSVLVYVPPVQDFVKRKAADYVSRTMGVELEIERLRLNFPLRLSIRNTVLRTQEGDTVARVGYMRVGVAPIPLLRGSVQVRRFLVREAAVDWADSTMMLRGNLRRVMVGRVRVRPSRGRVFVGSVELSGADLELDLKSAPATDTIAKPPSKWTILVRNVAVDSVKFRMDSTLTAGLVRGSVDDARMDLGAGETTVGRAVLEGVEGRYKEVVDVRGARLDARDFYNKGGAIALTVNKLTGREGRGIEVRDMRGKVRMDSLAVEVDALRLETAKGSRVALDLKADAAALTGAPTAAVDVRLDALMAAADVAQFYELPVQSASVVADVEGTLNNLNIKELRVDAAPFVDFSTTGHINPFDLAGDLELSARLNDLNTFLPIELPQKITIDGTIATRKNIYEPNLKITADGGHLELKGSADLNAKTYAGVLSAVDFPLDYLAPLGRVSLTAAVDGAGFDPLSPEARLKANVDVQQLVYQGFSYAGTHLDATLSGGHLVAKANNAQLFTLDAEADLAPQNYRATIAAKIDTLDLEKMGFSTSPLKVHGVVNASATAVRGAYTADITVDSAVVNTLTVEKTTLTARADTARVVATVRSGDIYAVLNSPVGINRLASNLKTLSDSLTAQVASRYIRPEVLDSLMPPLHLNVVAGRRNAVVRALMAEGTMGFGTFSLTASKSDTASLRARALATGFHNATLMLDTLNLGASVRGDHVSYFLRMANRPGNLEKLASIYLYGTARGNQLTANFNQRNRAEQSGFAFGVEATVGDSLVRASLVPVQGRRRGTKTDSLTFAYEPWGVNKGNYVEWRGGRNIRADLDLQSHEIRAGVRRRVSVHTVDSTGRIALSINELDIAKTLDLLPAPPPVKGMVDIAMTLGLGNVVELNGTAAARSVLYDESRVGDLGVKIATHNAHSDHWDIAAEATVDNNSALSVSGTYDARSIDLKLDLPALPLAAVNPFIPGGMAVLRGSLTGSLTAKGPLATPRIDGSLVFKDSRLNLPLTGTNYHVTPDPVRITNNIVHLAKFGITSPNNHLLSLDGTVDLSKMNADLDLQATDFQAVSSSRTVGSQIYGTAALDADMTITGPLDRLSIRGKTTIKRSTNVTYTMADSPLDVEQQRSDIVTFIPFTDSLALELQALKRRVKSSSVDMQVGVTIEPEARATVNISDNGNDRIELTGGGALSMTMNPEGDMRLTGRYALTGGTVVYNPPIPTVTQKNFTVANGSYVNWTGIPAAPQFNINAAQTVRTTVVDIGTELSRNVDFRISVAISGTLEAMQITFDLAAPNDLSIQNELSSLEPEQRAAQAMALMIYNTYTGPGTTARVDTNNAVYSFIEKELNQWARNSLRGVDLSVGIKQGEDDLGNRHTDYSYKVSKSLFNDRVKLSVGGNISDQSAAYAESEMRNNFVSDIALEYRVAKFDNLFLKAYRYNTRPSILEGEVTETGGGVLYRKSAQRLKYLFRLRRSPEKREALRQQREAERDTTIMVNGQ